MTTADIALTLQAGLGPTTAARLIDRFATADAIYAASETTLVEAGLRRDIAKAVTAHTAFAQAETEQKRMARYGIEAIAATDADYPPLLRDTPDRPHVIYIMGNRAALAQRTLSIVGTRNSSSYGAIITDRMVEYLAKRIPNLCIVSGLAFGTDSNAHRAALQHGLHTVAVVPACLPDVVPSEHTALARDIVAQGGLLISESTQFTHFTRNNFVSRNRIIAALSAGTIVVESKRDGGSMTTASFASGYNRTLMAVPGRATDTVAEGSNRLIVSREAAAVCSGEDVIREMCWDFTDATVGVLNFDRTPVEAEQQRLLDAMPDAESISTDDLAERTALDKGTLSELLISLELDGYIKRLPGDCCQKI